MISDAGRGSSGDHGAVTIIISGFCGVTTVVVRIPPPLQNARVSVCLYVCM